MVDDELAGQSQQILVQALEQGGDNNHSQVMGRHLVHLREHLDSAEKHTWSQTYHQTWLSVSHDIHVAHVIIRLWVSLCILHVEVPKQGVECCSVVIRKSSYQPSVG